MSLMTLISLAIILGLSRIYNGVHTYNQVISGFTWGLITYTSLCHVFYQYITTFVTNVKTMSAWLLATSPFIRLFIASHLLAIGLYEYNIAFNPIPESWG